jgi:phosphatidylinositol alpha-mannosyltransferase
MPHPSKLTIGFVFDDSLDKPDGVQQYVLTLGDWMKKQGHSVHYLVGATTRDDIANVHSLSRNMRVAFNGNRMSVPLPSIVYK